MLAFFPRSVDATAIACASETINIKIIIVRHCRGYVHYNRFGGNGNRSSMAHVWMRCCGYTSRIVGMTLSVSSGSGVIVPGL